MNEKLILLRRIVYIIIGSFIYSFALNTLFVPHEFLSGGIAGIALIFQYLFHWPTGISIAILNIPLFVGGYRYISKRFAYLSMLGIGCVSVFMELTKNWTLEVQDPMVAAIFGGLLTGIGTGIVLKNRGSLGGTDIIAVIVNKYLSFSIGGVSMAFNGIVLTIATLVFSLEMAMYTMIAIFVANKAVDAIQEGFNHRKTLLIISDKAEELSEELFKSVHRGITYLHGEGAYTHKQKKILYMVVRTMELARVRDVIRRVDPAAFYSIIDTRDVEGKGFSLGDLF